MILNYRFVYALPAIDSFLACWADLSDGDGRRWQIRIVLIRKKLESFHSDPGPAPNPVSQPPRAKLS